MEPKCIYATVREAISDIGDREFHIECRFSDGQKFAAVIVDGEFENLAFNIAEYLRGLR